MDGHHVHGGLDVPMDGHCVHGELDVPTNGHWGAHCDADVLGDDPWESFDDVLVGGAEPAVPSIRFAPARLDNQSGVHAD
jgi:hypothetical protein